MANFFGVVAGAITNSVRSVASIEQIRQAQNTLREQRFQNTFELGGKIAIDGNGGRRVMFNVTPEISEAKNVSYVEISDIRQAASMVWFDGSPSRTFQISAKFLARTVDEADQVFKDLNLLRSWTTPDPNTIDTVGAKDSPEVVRLYGYGEVFRGITCVVSSLNIEYPTDVDYVTASNGSDIPIVQSVSISLKEVHTADDLVAFNIEAFRAGTLEGW